MARNVSDSDSVRRQNRGLVLGALRVQGPLSRTALAADTGLSHASITAITHDLIGQDIIAELRSGREAGCAHARPPGDAGGFQSQHRRRRPVRNRRQPGAAVAGRLWRRAGRPHRNSDLARRPSPKRRRRCSWPSVCGTCRRATSAESTRLRRVAISVQGILDRDGLRAQMVAHRPSRRHGRSAANWPMPSTCR